MFQKNYLRATLAARDEVSPPEVRKDYVNLPPRLFTFFKNRIGI
jgi:hypothetical protein